MGFLDDARRLRELKEANPDIPIRELQIVLDAEKHGAAAAKFDDQFAAAAVVPYIEVVPAKLYKKDLNAFVKTYIGIVGLLPEDMFGIYTQPYGESAGPLSIVYRDRPEYSEGRRRYRRAVLGE